MSQIFKCRILENNKVRPDCFKMIFTAPQIAQHSIAGQFVHIRCTPSIDPLLRRPFSIHRVSGNKIEILYKVIGKGSAELSKRKVGEIVDLIGPLGNGFKVWDNLKIAILVAGGIGVAPLIMLAEKIRSIRASEHQSIRVLIGAKTKKEILCEEQFRKLGSNIKIATEDGSKGFKGLVTELLLKEVSEYQSVRACHSLPCLPVGVNSSRNPRKCQSVKVPGIYACGPKEMLKSVAEISQRYKIPTQVSLEENMACGIGACYGCSVKTKDGYKLVCKDGPVFNANDIIWE